MQELLTSYADPAAGQGQVMWLDEDQHDQIHMLLLTMEMSLTELRAGNSIPVFQ
ncbi:hypothetical protein L915_17446 [Phytophthora nicotianae]|uniref:Uncharacterized protein n=1 Tax=Phytophthora nicotianae TaxID=4792 RepID=W2FZ20_PHYNI|nr:hypothetical protein L915_17446 [Phytophthora nicotianae]ETL29493.1 hypothetical protein L916_17337 [Phytophthora nicotianae]